MNPLWKIAAFASGAFLAACAATPAANVPVAESYRGKAKAGHALAIDLCSGCHAVERREASVVPAAPPFRTLLSRYDRTKLADGLQRGVMMSHPDMPRVFLTETSAKDLIAYLKTIDEK